MQTTTGFRPPPPSREREPVRRGRRAGDLVRRSRDIPLSQLELSPDNVRKTPADASAFTELKASIAAHGLLENLIARAMEPGLPVVWSIVSRATR